MAGASRDDKIIVEKLKSVQFDDSILQVEIEDLAKQYFHVLMLREDFADGRSNFCRRQASRSHLIEQRLEGVVIRTIDQGDLYTQACQGLCGLQSAKSTTNDNDSNRLPVGHDPTLERCASFHEVTNSRQLITACY